MRSIVCRLSLLFTPDPRFAPGEVWAGKVLVGALSPNVFCHPAPLRRGPDRREGRAPPVRSGSVPPGFYDIGSNPLYSPGRLRSFCRPVPMGEGDSRPNHPHSGDESEKT